MLTSSLERASWSVGPFSASPVLLAGLEMADVTVRELVAQTPFGMGTIDVVATCPLGSRLLSAFPAGTTIFRRGTSFDISAPMVPRGYLYQEADQLPFFNILDRTLPATILAALPGRPLSCLIETVLSPLKKVDPAIATADVTWQSEVPILSITLDMDWVSVAKEVGS